jgi:tetratricopeptide (TPR) repeat protein
MGYFFNDRFLHPQSRPATSEAIDRWSEIMQTGEPSEQKVALQSLILAGAEDALARLLRSANPTAAQLATTGLWECWFNERGLKARKLLESGSDALGRNDLDEAETTFGEVMKRYPGWTEAINKYATTLFMKGQAERSLELANYVVIVKPHHFGAWNGLAMAAVQLERWETAHEAVIQALELQPRSELNRELLRYIQERAPETSDSRREA